MDAKTLVRIEALSGCDSLDTLYAATKSIVAEIGFDYFIYGVRVATSLTHPNQFVFSGYPAEWRRHYLRQLLTRATSMPVRGLRNFPPPEWPVE